MEDFLELQCYGWMLKFLIFFVSAVLTIVLWKFVQRKFYVVVFALLDLIFFGYLMSQQLETKIAVDGISYRMSPVQRKFTTVSWQEVSSLEIRDKIVYSRRNTNYDVYTISDKYGLFITTKDGKKVIIGTKLPELMKLTILHFHPELLRRS
jgi:hypothetical protein